MLCQESMVIRFPAWSGKRSSVVRYRTQRLLPDGAASGRTQAGDSDVAGLLMTVVLHTSRSPAGRSE